MGGGSRVEDSVGRNRFSCTMLSTFLRSKYASASPFSNVQRNDAIALASSTDRDVQIPSDACPRSCHHRIGHSPSRASTRAHGRDRVFAQRSETALPTASRSMRCRRRPRPEGARRRSRMPLPTTARAARKATDPSIHPTSKRFLGWTPKYTQPRFSNQRLKAHNLQP